MQVMANDDAGEMLQREGVITGQTDTRSDAGLGDEGNRSQGDALVLLQTARSPSQRREPAAKCDAGRVPPAASPVPMGNLSLRCGCAVQDPPGTAGSCPESKWDEPGWATCSVMQIPELSSRGGKCEQFRMSLSQAGSIWEIKIPGQGGMQPPNPPVAPKSCDPPAFQHRPMWTRAADPTEMLHLSAGEV